MSDPAALRTVAPAKINWTLEVLGRREDGYHEIRSVMQTISLADDLEVRPASSLSLQVDGPEAAGLASDDNLVVRAARVFPQQLRARPVAFRLHKNVPAAAGLGGGSSDAAAALRLLRRFWRLRKRAKVDEVAASLGADVPFFLRGGAQVIAGRGDAVTPLPATDPTHIILVTPPIAVAQKTARLYAELRSCHYTDGAATARLAAKLRDGRTPTPDDYVNVFDAVADVVFPRLAEYRRTLERVTGSRAMLAGAGPSLFAVCRDDANAGEQRDWEAELRRTGAKVWIVQTTGPVAAGWPGKDL